MAWENDPFPGHADDEFRAWDSDDGADALLAQLPTEPEPDAFQQRAGSYKDESGQLFILKEFTLPAFAQWFAVQGLGTLPYNGIGVHHTWKPTGSQFVGTATVRSIFEFYRDTYDWKYGKGPHLWLYGGDNPRYKSGQTLVVVGTHPAHDGIGITGRNHRWLHIECFGDFDSNRMPKNCVDGYRFLLRLLSERRNQPVKVNPGPATSRPSTWQGALFHRDAKTDKKSCPGTTTTHAWFDAAMRADGPSTPVPVKPVTPATSFLAEPRGSLNRAMAYLRSFDTGSYNDQDVGNIVAYYWATAKPIGLDPLLALAQMALETGHLSSAASQPPRRNPAGIGITSDNVQGISFPDWISACRAHIGRLAAYAIRKGAETPEQRVLIDEALAHRPLDDSYRGRAPTLAGLTGSWATDDKYANKIADLANRMIQHAV